MKPGSRTSEDSSSIVGSRRVVLESTKGNSVMNWGLRTAPAVRGAAPTGAFGGPVSGGLVRIVANDEGLHLHSRDGELLSVSEHNCINGGYYYYDRSRSSEERRAMEPWGQR